MSDWRQRLVALRNRIFGGPTSEVREEPLASPDLESSAKGLSDEPALPDRPAPPPLRPEKPAERITAPRPPNRAKPLTSDKRRRDSVSRYRPGTRKPPEPASSPGSQLRPVAINLGIDFGTSFTKVCFRDVATEESGVVAIGADEAVVASVVAIAQTGRLSLGAEAAPSVKVRVPYLKMRLAGAPIGNALPAVHGIDLNASGAIKALSAWLLATVIARSQAWVALNQSERLKGRRVVWSANVGVPVEHYDSPILKTFEEVLGVAWLWARDAIPETLQQATGTYDDDAAGLDGEMSDFHAVAEIAAAVQSFVMSREAQEGIYVYFDIGGGTVDGVAFNYLNRQGERRINFYSGKVAPLGLAALAGSVGSDNETLDTVRFEGVMADLDAADKQVAILKVRRLVAEVIMTAKRKDGRNWQEDAIHNADYERKFVGHLTQARMKPLIVFLGGGGSRSTWYFEAIGSTYAAFGHHNAGVPPYKLLQVPSPKDFELGDTRHDFNRFAISYGLAVPFGEGPDIGLPSEFADAEPMKPRELAGVVDYANNKDAYD